MLLLGSGKPKPPKTPDLLKPVAHGLEHTFIKLWPLWLLLGLIALGKVAWRAYQLHRLSKSGIREIDQMSGHRFEEYLGTLFRRLGYHVELTRRHGDYGADLVVTKGKTRTAVQAKCWSKRVGVKAVREAVASKGMYGCDSALVVANREFTQQAQKLARANRVELWGRSVLVDKLLSVRSNEPTEQLKLEPRPATPPALTPIKGMTDAAVSTMQLPTTTAVTLTTATPRTTTSPVAGIAPATCVTCGATVSEKVRAYCEEHSERFGGRIYCFEHQRGVGALPATD
jgi:restriction system protein